MGRRKGVNKMELNQIQKLVYEEYVKNGYEVMWNKTYGTDGYELAEILRKNDLAELSLVDTETTEAKEEVRNLVIDDVALAKECADIIIRVLNFMTRKGLMNAEEAILNKHAKNMKRELKHGRGL
jgi:hypothetical protein